MDGAHAHLLFNHFPIIGSIISVLVLVTGFLLKNNIVKKTALAIIVFTSVMTIPAFTTGEEAEEALEAINQAPDSIIHEHEELAEIGLWTTICVGLAAAFTFFNSRKVRPKIVCCNVCNANGQFNCTCKNRRIGRSDSAYRDSAAGGDG
ncbi:MAG: hypothetical protein IPN88_19485 [Bacteroidetes bacterium]|nr:hypothetical protein [Bacteroidota bacterium]